MTAPKADRLPTYCDCVRCSRICRGMKKVRKVSNEDCRDHAHGRYVAFWEPTNIRFPNFTFHRRPVCSDCVTSEELVREALACGLLPSEVRQVKECAEDSAA